MTCHVPGCGRVALCKLPSGQQVCDPHYGRWRRHGDVQADVPVKPKPPARPRPRCSSCGRTVRWVWAERCPACNASRRESLDALVSVPLGTEREWAGLVWVKVAQPGQWIPRALHVWLTVHGRDMPGGHVLLHVDGNRMNDDPTNLRLIWQGGPRAVA